MTRLSIRPLMWVIFIVLFAIGSCTSLDEQADKRLGVDCTPEARILRASLLTKMIEKNHGRKIAIGLRKDLKLMRKALKAGADLQIAGEAYQIDFVIVAVKVLAIAGIKINLGGYAEAINQLRKLPYLIADFKRIEARVGIACAVS